MKTARIVVLVLAGSAGIAAAALVGGFEPSAPPPVQVASTAGTEEVLVAKGDIGLGQTIDPSNVEWQAWSSNTSSSQFLKKSERPRAIEEMTGSVARSPFFVGEPVREVKLIKGNGSGFMAAILPSGKRAVSTEITPENGASGFILPNDRVDVILTRVQKTPTGTEAYSSETILTNVRVLAIDQQIDEKNTQKVVVGKIALLELDPSQAESVALARRLGTLSLTLRSVRDAAREGEDLVANNLSPGSTINVVRFGQSTPVLVK